MAALSVQDLFRCVHLNVDGEVPWGKNVPVDRCGVYVISIIEPVDVPEEFRARWSPGETIIYIGRTARTLRRRLQEFYRHKHGDKRPHRGGQDILKIPVGKTVHYAATDDCKDIEARMIEAFERHTGGRKPFGNVKKPGLRASRRKAAR